MTASSPFPQSSPPRVLVLGLGNDLLRDDAIGLRVAEALRSRLAARPDVTVLQSLEMGLALLDLVTGYDELVLVDSVQTGHAPPGYVHELDADQMGLLPNGSPHFLGIGEMLALGRELRMPVPRRARIFAVEVEDPFTLGQEMTPALSAAMPAVVSRLEAALGGACAPG